MRSLLLFFCLLPACASLAQNDSTCDSLLLKNGKFRPGKMIRVTDSLVFYRLCGSNSEKEVKIVTYAVKGILKDNRLQFILPGGVLTDAMPFAGKVPELPGKMNPVKRWVFKKKMKQLTRKIKEGQSIKVITNNRSGRKKHIGSLVDISTDSLLLQDNSESLLRFSKNQITEIRIPKRGKKVGKTGGAVLVGGGLFAGLLGLGLLVSLVGLVLTIAIISVGTVDARNSQSGKDLKKGANIGCLLFTLLPIAGLIFFLASRDKVIENPFSNKWERTEVVEGVSGKMNP